MLAGRAQALLGLHAAALLLVTESPPVIDLAGDGWCLPACCISFAALLAAMPWWRKTLASKQCHGTAYAVWFWACVSLALAAHTIKITSLTASVAVNIFRHTCLLSALFLLLQTALATPLQKGVYGALLTCGLIILRDDDADNSTLLCAYTIAVLWCWWVLYDTVYWHAQLQGKFACELAMLAVCDVISALFAAPHLA
jgi:hypothetical protein